MTPDTPHKPYEFRASDGFGPLDSSSIPRTREAASTPCLGGRWFSPRPSHRNAQPCLPALAPKLATD